MCGCDLEKQEDVAANPKTFDTVMFDEEGYLICKIHRARPYGWRDPGYTTVRKEDFTYRVFDPEQARREANVPVMPRYTAEIHDVPDKRDLRDAQDLGEVLLAHFGEDIVATGRLSLSDYYDLRTGQNMPPRGEDVELLADLRDITDPDRGRQLLEYQRELAQSQIR